MILNRLSINRIKLKKTVGDGYFYLGARSEFIGIRIVVPPNKLNYEPGDDLDITGLVVHGIYYGGKEEVIPNSLLGISPTHFDTIGTKVITVTYQGFSDTFNVNVALVPVQNITGSDIWTNYTSYPNKYQLKLGNNGVQYPTEKQVNYLLFTEAPIGGTGWNAPQYLGSDTGTAELYYRGDTLKVNDSTYHIVELWTQQTGQNFKSANTLGKPITNTSTGVVSYDTIFTRPALDRGYVICEPTIQILKEKYSTEVKVGKYAVSNFVGTRGNTFYYSRNNVVNYLADRLTIYIITDRQVQGGDWGMDSSSKTAFYNTNYTITINDTKRYITKCVLEKANNDPYGTNKSYLGFMNLSDFGSFNLACYNGTVICDVSPELLIRKYGD